MPRKVKKYAPGEDRPKGRRADGRLSTKIKIGNGINGRPLYKYAYGYTKTELAAAVDELKRKHITGNVDIRRDVLFSVYAQEFYDAYKKTQLAPAGRETYLTALNAHLLPAFGDRQMRAITSTQLQMRINDIAVGSSDSKVRKVILVVKQLFKQAIVDGVIDRNPALSIKMPAASSGTRRPLTDAERAAVLKVGHNHKDGLLLLLLYYTGGRIGEALGLWCQDIDLAADTIHFHNDIDYKVSAKEKAASLEAGEEDPTVGDVKTPSSDRFVPIPDQLHAALAPVVQDGRATDYVFKAPITGGYWPKSTYVRRWTALMQAVYLANPSIESKEIKDYYNRKAKKEEDPKKPDTPRPRQSILTPHYFRHNYATMLYDADIDVLSAQKWLGHKDIQTTLRFYAHLSRGKEDKNVAKLKAMFKEQTL